MPPTVSQDPEHAEIMAHIDNLQDTIRTEIRGGLDLVKQEIKTIIAERDKDILVKIGAIDVYKTQIDNDLHQKDREIKKLFSIVDELRAQDEAQNKTLAENAGAKQQAEKLKTYMVSIMGIVATIAAVFITYFLSRG